MNRIVVMARPHPPNETIGVGKLLVGINYNHMHDRLQTYKVPEIMLFEREELVIRRLGNGTVEVFTREWI